MPPQGPEAERNSPPSWALDKRRWILLALTTATWLISFSLVERFGTWIPFVLLGPAVAVLTLKRDPGTLDLVRFSWRQLAVGLLSGGVMVALTHALYPVAAALIPAVVPETRALYALLHKIGSPPAVTAGLVATVAVSEEFLFRGTLASVPDSKRAPARTLLLALIYALPPVASGNPALVAAALVCGLIWGTLRAATGGVTAPAACHTVWDLGVLFVWPLTR